MRSTEYAGQHCASPLPITYIVMVAGDERPDMATSYWEHGAGREDVGCTPYMYILYIRTRVERKHGVSLSRLSASQPGSYYLLQLPLQPVIPGEACFFSSRASIVQMLLGMLAYPMQLGAKSKAARERVVPSATTQEDWPPASFFGIFTSPPLSSLPTNAR